MSGNLNPQKQKLIIYADRFLFFILIHIIFYIRTSQHSVISNQWKKSFTQVKKSFHLCRLI